MMDYVNRDDFVKKYGNFPDFILSILRGSVKENFNETHEIGDIYSFIATSLFIDVLYNIKPEARVPLIQGLAKNYEMISKEMEERSKDEHSAAK